MNIHGGIVQSVNVAGDAVIHGGMVNKLIVHGNCKQYGGIVNQRVTMKAEQPNTANKAQPNTAAPNTAEPKTDKQPEPQIIYKDKIVYKEREKIVYRDRLPEESKRELDKLRKLTKHYYSQTKTLENEVLRHEKTISRLEDRLAKALNRERVAVLSRKDAEKELARVMANQWDSYRPTKEEVKRFYEVTLNLLDCEDF